MWTPPPRKASQFFFFSRVDSPHTAETRRTKTHSARRFVRVFARRLLRIGEAQREFRFASQGVCCVSARTPACCVMFTGLAFSRGAVDSSAARAGSVCLRLRFAAGIARFVFCLRTAAHALEEKKNHVLRKSDAHATSSALRGALAFLGSRT